MKKCKAVEPEFGWRCVLDEHPENRPGPGYHRDAKGNAWYGLARRFANERERKAAESRGEE